MSRKTRTLHVGVAQVHSDGGPEEVLARIGAQTRAAAAVGVEVLLFAEGVLHGYDYELTARSVRRLAEPADSANCRALSRLARKTGVHLLVGFFELDGADIYNSHLVARADGTREVQRKHRLTAGEQKACLCPGPSARTVFTFGGVRTAIIICADGGIPKLHRVLAEQGVEYRFCPTGGGGWKSDMLSVRDLRTAAGRRQYRQMRSQVFNTEAILKKQGARVGFASANALGPAGRRTCHQGHCMIVDNDFVMRAQIPGTPVREHQQDQMVHAALTF